MKKHLKKLASLCLSFIIIFSTIITGSSVTVTETYSYDFENFEEFNYPWTTSGSVSVVADPTNKNNSCLFVDDTNSSISKADLFLKTTDTVFTYGFKVMYASYGNSAISLFPDAPDVPQISINAKPDGSLNYYNGSSVIKICDYKLNSWISIEIEANPKTDKYSLNVDGNTVATNLSFRTGGQGYGYIAGMRIGTGSTTTASLYVDDITVPVLNIEKVEKYIPQYKQIETLSNTPADAEMQYHCFPTMKRINDREVLIVYRRGVKHAWSHGILETILYDTVEQKVISRTVLDDTIGINDQNPELLRMPNGDLVVYCDQQEEDEDGGRLGIATFRSTDNGKSWTKDVSGLIDNQGIEYGYTFDDVILGNDIYMLAMTFPELENKGHGRSVHIIKSSDNGQSWQHVNDLNAEFDYSFNESSIVEYKDGFIIIARGDNKLTKALVIDIKGNKITERSLSYEFECIDNIARPHIFVEDGKYYLMCRNIPANSGNYMELILYSFDAETLSLTSHVELEPGNTGNNGGDGFYAEYYLQERDGVVYFNVVTYSKAYTSNYKPSIIRLEYIWDEIANAGVDAKAPTISVTENEKYYTTQKIVVNDTYLKTVTLSGEDVTQKTKFEGTTQTVTLTFDKESYDYSTVANGTGRDALGIASATSGDTTNARIYIRPEGIDDSGAVKWATSKMTCGVMLGGGNRVGAGYTKAYVLKPETDYTVKFNIKHTAGAGVTVKLVGTATYTDTEGYEIYSEQLSTTNSNWTEYTATFTTPIKEVLGDNKYLSVIVTKPDSLASYTVLLDNVTITESTKDKYITDKLQTVTLPGNTNATYTLVATDESGNATEKTITMKSISNIDSKTISLTESNVTEDDRQSIVSAKAVAEQVISEYGTYEEKQELDTLILKYNKLLLVLDGQVCVEHEYSYPCDESCNLCGELRENVAHTYDDIYDAECNDCGFIRKVVNNELDTGVFASSLRKPSGSGENYKSAGVRFRAKLSKETANSATEIGFVIVPAGYGVNSSLSVVGVNKTGNTNLIYSTDETTVDYQVIFSGLTKENVKKSLKGLSLDVYFYCVLDGQKVYIGEKYTDSYDEVLRRLNGVDDNESFADSDLWWDLAT